MKLLVLGIIFYKMTYIQSLTCDDVLEFPPSKNLTLSELKTMSPKDIVQCLPHLGKEKLPSMEADFIWQTLKNYYEQVENIPESVLVVLHWVTTAVKPEDYANMTLDNIDVIENFGLNYNLHHDQLAAIADRVREDFAGKYPEDYTYYDLMALRQILCEFNRSEIERIHPSAYREAALMIGKLENCSPQTLLGFSTLAMTEDAFGSPDKWTKATIQTMGKVAEYLPKDLIERFKVDSNKEST